MLARWLLVAHCDLAGRCGRVEASHLVLIVDLDRLAQRRDLDHSDSIPDKPDEPNGLWHVTVDPLFIASAARIAALLFADLAFRCAKRGENHPMIHSNQDFVSRDGFLQRVWKGIGVGLLGGFDAEVDDWLE